uniref:Peptidase M20 dimerisation domain-containing protein n=1 Tax=Timema poppense TaxID=170557 RepID=A0A7R9H245_TIMPO|nr:unnamed protein product [Timema poppensis]
MWSIDEPLGVIRGDGREGPGYEEIGGIDGMDKFVKTSHFLKLNVGFILDEGITSSDKNFVLFYGERSLWTVHIHCTSPNRKNSTEKVQIVVDHFVQFRQEQKVKLDSNPRLTPRDLTSMTLKAVKDAESELVLVFDVRVSATEDCSTLEELFSSWCESAGPGTYVSYEDKPTNSGLTHLDTCNRWWLTFRDECRAMNIELNPMICPGITDARHYRKVGLPALGFSPINNTPCLVHEADEFLNRKIFLDGIKIYVRLISALANVPAQ